jgi:hypothetical protein
VLVEALGDRGLSRSGGRKQAIASRRRGLDARLQARARYFMADGGEAPAIQLIGTIE